MQFGYRLSGLLAAVETPGANESGHERGLYLFHSARRTALQYELIRQSIEQMERRGVAVAVAREVYDIGVGIQKRWPKAIVAATGAFAACPQKFRCLYAKHLARHRLTHASLLTRIAHISPRHIQTSM